MPGSLTHLYRSDDPVGRTKSLCGLLEDPSNWLGGSIGTRKTANCSPCIDLARQTEIITAPVNETN